MGERRLQPWFGTWPPKLKGGEVNMESKTWWGRWRITVIMVFVLLSGIILLLGCNIFTQVRAEWKFIWDNLAIAIIIAGILGLTIDRLFRRQFAEDAFRASIGYVLPDELRGEMEWIYRCHIICTEHIQRFELLPIDNETCIIRVNTLRKLRNVSGSVDYAKLGLGIDEWFHNTGSSQIISVSYTKEGKRWSGDEEGLGIHKVNGSIFIAEREIPLAPSEEFTVCYTIEEVKRINDDLHWNFSHTTLNPLVTVKTYEGVDFSVSFGYRIPSEKLSDDTYQLSGTLLPGQTITLRWWKVEDVKKWIGTA